MISELPDPRLKGDFPKEEMQIMAYLAKECLQLDPDARPTMSEVVQILSTIAPDKSRRRNISLNLFQVITMLLSSFMYFQLTSTLKINCNVCMSLHTLETPLRNFINALLRIY